MDSYFIKLQGKAELPKPLSIGHNFRVLLEGSIIGEETTDNDDGSFNHAFKFQPIVVEAVTPTGETIKARDTRSRSVQLRMTLMREWRENNETMAFEDYYNEEMLKIIASRIHKL
jgi:hypothetical protein